MRVIWAPFLPSMSTSLSIANGDLARNEVFKGGSIVKTVCQPFCKNPCLVSLTFTAFLFGKGREHQALILLTLCGR